MNLLTLIKQKAPTLEKFAEQSKVSLNTIKRALKGRNLRHDSKYRLALALNISVEKLEALITDCSDPLTVDMLTVSVNQIVEELNDLGLPFLAPNGKAEDSIASYIEEDLSKKKGERQYFTSRLVSLGETSESKGSVQCFETTRITMFRIFCTTGCAYR